MTVSEKVGPVEVEIAMGVITIKKEDLSFFINESEWRQLKSFVDKAFKFISNSDEDEIPHGIVPR